MFQSARAPKPTLLLALVGAAAVGAGLFLPRLLPSVEPHRTGPIAPHPVASDPPPLHYQPQAWPDAPSSRDVLTRLALGTALVLGLCVASLWVGRRWLGAGAAAATGPGHMRLVETLALGNRCCVHLVRAAGQTVLVGTDAAGLKAMLPVGDSFAEALAGVESAVPATDGAAS